MPPLDAALPLDEERTQPLPSDLSAPAPTQALAEPPPRPAEPAATPAPPENVKARPIDPVFAAPETADHVEGWGPRPQFRGARGEPSFALNDTETPAVNEKMKLPAERWNHLEQENPVLHKTIERVASDVGVPAIDLANIAFASSGFKPGTPGGYMNITPETAKRLDPSGHFNPNDPVDNVYLGAVKYKELSDHFGVSTSSALGAYGMTLETIQQMSRLSPEDQRKHYPQVFDYLRRLGSGAKEVSDRPVEKPGEMTPETAKAAGLTVDDRAKQLQAAASAPEMQQAPTEMPGAPRGAPYSGAQVPPNVARRQAIAAAEAPEMQQAPTVMSSALDLSGMPAPPEPQRPMPGPTPATPVVPGETRTLAGDVVPPSAPVDVQKIDPYSGMPIPVPTAAAGAKPVDPAAGAALATALPGAPLPPPERSRADTLPFVPTGGAPAAALPGAPATGTSTPPAPPPARPTPAPGAPAGAPAAPGQPTAAQLNQDELARIRAGQPPGPPGAPIPNVTTPSGAVAQPVGQGGGGPAAPAVGGPGRTAGEPPPIHGSGSVSMPGLVRAGMQGGPQGVMSYMVQNAPRGMSTNDMWGHVDSLLSQAFILRGDMLGAQRAREYVFQMQHAGSNQALMQAYGAMRVGDAVGAANLLAKSHAFVPDGSTMAFKVGPVDPRSGQPTLWGQRFVDQTGQPVGKPLQVTPEGIASMLNQTLDPQQFLKTLNTERQTISKIAHNQAMEGLRNKAIDVTAGTAEKNRVERAREADQAQKEATGRTQIQIDAANQRAAEANQRMRDIAAARKGEVANARRNQITKEADALYSDETSPTYIRDMEPDKRAQSQDLHAALRTHNPDMQSGTAQRVTGGILSNKFSMRPTADGRYAVLDKPDNSGTVVAYLPATAMRAFGRGAGEAPAQAPAKQPQQQAPAR